MSPAAFSRRVDELRLIHPGMTVDEAISQTAWEMDHGRTEIDVPLVVMEAAA